MSWYNCGNNSVSVCSGERILSAGKCMAWNCQNRNRVGRVIRGVYGSGNNSVCMCRGE